MAKSAFLTVCLVSVVLLLSMSPAQTSALDMETVILSKEVLQDKIRGVWASQTIGVTFGTPVEFEYNSTMIPDYKTIK